MRVVLDANVLTRAMASPGGPAGEVFERVCGDHILVVSLELLDELARVLTYDRVRRLHQQSDEAVADFIDAVGSGSVVVALPSPLPRVVPDDPDDDLLVATAVVGRADVLCTRNRHLFHERVVTYCEEHAIEIMDDLALLDRLRANHDGPEPDGKP
jgi:putative PIN family toxin of toxin-antitoxin system